MNLIEKLGLEIGDQVQYTGSVDTTIYTVKEVHQDFVVASGGAFDFLTMFNNEIRKVKSLEADYCTDIRNHISPNTKVIEQ
ncbi:hypothetical protein [Acinetobacter sp. YH12103]|uniref:hypothetical protein n=1 Tax=Acinetobacter sp. YH12103 TaxID=2601092 RepID=UPI0015D3B588|nr:hypothetical protein [Acinetobacter sp. YH12103]